MKPFPLQIVTPDGVVFDGEAEQLTVRTVGGDMGILAGHINCVAPLGKGRAAVFTGGERRCADCSGGILSVMNGMVTVASGAFVWESSV